MLLVDGLNHPDHKPAVLMATNTFPSSPTVNEDPHLKVGVPYSLRATMGGGSGHKHSWLVFRMEAHWQN
jgi:hypothetical protein